MIPGMMNDDAKPLAAMLEGPSEEKKEEKEDEFDSEVAFEAMADDMMSALEMKDARAFKKALFGFMELKEMKHESMESDD